MANLFWGFSPEHVERVARLCEKALETAGFSEAEITDINASISNQIDHCIAKGFGGVSPVEFITNAYVTETTNALKNKFPNVDISCVNKQYRNSVSNPLPYCLEINGKQYLGGDIMSIIYPTPLDKDQLTITDAHTEGNNGASFNLNLSMENVICLLDRCGINPVTTLHRDDNGITATMLIGDKEYRVPLKDDEIRYFDAATQYEYTCLSKPIYLKRDEIVISTVDVTHIEDDFNVYGLEFEYRKYGVSEELFDNVIDRICAINGEDAIDGNISNNDSYLTVYRRGDNVEMTVTFGLDEIRGLGCERSVTYDVPLLKEEQEAVLVCTQPTFDNYLEEGYDMGYGDTDFEEEPDKPLDETKPRNKSDYVRD